MRSSQLGLKDMLERIGGKKEESPRGTRGARQQRRNHEDGTREMQTPAGWQAQSEPQRPARPVTEPVAPAPPPAYQAPENRPAAPAAPPPAAAPARPATPAGSAAATIIGPSPFHTTLVGVLVGVRGDLKGKMFAVRDGDNDLGRSEDCGIRLQDPQISRVAQAQIVHQDGVFVLRALRPDRPVYLNDEPIVEADALSDGDELKLGGSSFRFRTIDP